MVNSIEKQLVRLFETWSNERVSSIMLLPASGSNRKYYRIVSENKCVIGAYNNNVRENVAFCRFTETFLRSGVSVPEIFVENLDESIYILEDLGDTTLFNILCREYHTERNVEHVKCLYRKVVEQLIRLQTEVEVDYSLCYPRDRFDRSSMMWDLNYFKYYFLQLAGIHADEQELENDFETLVGYLEKVPSNYFMFRDFQSRNIMVSDDDKLTFIDYQGGRRGALQYDLASLLYDGKAGLTSEFREEILDYYIELMNDRQCVAKNISTPAFCDLDKNRFKEEFYAFVLIRIMQSLGTYGFRGFFERKSHFLLSIPYAQANLRWILSNVKFGIDIPVISNCLREISENEKLSRYGVNMTEGLTLNVCSFAFKNGYPEDYSGNGGGFVFDCRGLPNPGRYDEYKSLTGMDEEVIAFFAANSNIDEFVEKAFESVEPTIENYLERGFRNLSVSFGCTGGQHRSVYSAERFVKLLNDKYIDIDVELSHRELNVTVMTCS